MLRVFVTITGLNVGGAEKQLALLVQGLVREGWAFEVASFAGGCTMEERMREAGASVVVQPAGLNLLQRLRWLRRQVALFSPDVILTFTLQANVLGRLVGHQTKTPVISSIRNTRFGGSRWYGQWLGERLERITSPLSHAIVINSKYAADELVKRGAVPASKVIVIPNGVDPGADSPRLNTTTAEQQGRGFLWLAVGRLVPQKNFLALITAFSGVVKVRPAARLAIAGEGRLRPAIEQTISSLGLTSSVTLLGERNDVNHLLQEADAFVLASSWEGMPNVVMEAMLNGTPTLATRVGGVPELIEDGRTGWLIASPGTEDLTAALLALMDEPESVRREVGEAGKRKILQDFGVSRMVSSWGTLIEETVRRSAS